MGEILGLGVTHYPALAGRDEYMAGILKGILQDPGLPDQYRHPESWPEGMRQEYGADEGLSAARRHREGLVAQFRKARQLYDTWRKTPLAALEESGQQEVLNWMCLAGAMAEMGRRPDATELIQTYIFNSSKCFAFFKP